MNTGGVTKRLFDFCDSLFGHIRGGLSYVTVLSSTIFSAISGSALANAAGLGSMQIKAMTDRNYPKNFSTSLVTTASVLGPIIPPSILMIIYGVTAGVSIQKQFMGGIIPGILYALMCCVMCFYYGKNTTCLWATNSTSSVSARSSSRPSGLCWPRPSSWWAS